MKKGSKQSSGRPKKEIKISDSPEWVSITDGADKIKESRQTIYNAIEDKRIRSKVVAKRTLVFV